MRMMRVFAAAIGAAVLAQAAEAPAQTLETVQSRGSLTCGVTEGLLGFSTPGKNGEWAGFDVDFCRALAAAIFNDASKVTYVPLSAADRFGALQSAKIDVLSRVSTWTMGREVELGLAFAGVNYYDGQGFMLRKSLNTDSALELGGRKVCVQRGTTTELNAADYFTENKMQFEPVLFDRAADMIEAYDDEKCDVFTADVSQLYAQRLRLSTPDEHTILPDIISKEPLGPVVRQGDEQWFNIVKWTLFAMINAEELGVNSRNIDAALNSQKPDVKRLVGNDGNYGERLGLTRDWVVRIVRNVGNYGEVFESNVGIASQLGIPRGVNQLWNAGGIQYAPPIR